MVLSPSFIHTQIYKEPLKAAVERWADSYHIYHICNLAQCLVEQSRCVYIIPHHLLVILGMYYKLSFLLQWNMSGHRHILQDQDTTKPASHLHFNCSRINLILLLAIFPHSLLIRLHLIALYICILYVYVYIYIL